MAAKVRADVRLVSIGASVLVVNNDYPKLKNACLSLM
jgi:hypothetical protein